MQSEQQDSILQGHLPECPTAWMRECICTELRMCAERVRQGMESLAHLYEQDAYMRGWREALHAARGAVSTLCNHPESMPNGWLCSHALAASAIDALRVTDQPTTSPVIAKPADLHDPQMGEMIHGDR